MGLPRTFRRTPKPHASYGFHQTHVCETCDSNPTPALQTAQTSSRSWLFGYTNTGLYGEGY